jgi:hypothetical protein
VSSDSDDKVTADAEKKASGSDNVQLVRVLPGRSRRRYELSQNRDETISAACDLLDRKINVQEIGSLLGMRDPGDIIDSVEIRKLHMARCRKPANGQR